MPKYITKKQKEDMEFWKENKISCWKKFTNGMNVFWKEWEEWSDWMIENRIMG